MMGKKFGDRRDGVKVKTGGFEKFFYYLKPRRSESEVHILREIDVTNLVGYYNRLKEDDEKITYFHLFATAIAKTIYNKPLLNRFVINGNYYDRNEVTLSFVAKTSFTDEAKELLNVIRVDKGDNLDKISNKIFGDVKKIRSSKTSGIDDFVVVFNKLPKFIIRFVVWVAKILDNHDMLPYSLTKDSIFHSTVLLSNLGSIHCGGIYHNLTNFGTNSVVVTIGEIKEKACVVDGEIEKRYVCEFGITLDERIADGVYFAKCVNLLEYILDNPSLLEDRVDVKIDVVKDK